MQDRNRDRPVLGLADSTAKHQQTLDNILNVTKLCRFAKKMVVGINKTITPYFTRITTPQDTMEYSGLSEATWTHKRGQYGRIHSKHKQEELEEQSYDIFQS